MLTLSKSRKEIGVNFAKKSLNLLVLNKIAHSVAILYARNVEITKCNYLKAMRNSIEYVVDAFVIDRTNQSSIFTKIY